MCMATLLSTVLVESCLGNMLPIVQAIDTNKFRWCGLVTRREEESMLRVMMQLKANGKRSRGDQDKGG